METLAVQVTLILACAPDEAADAINETLREHQRDFNPESCILDYAIGAVIRTGHTAEGYREGQAFEEA